MIELTGIEALQFRTKMETEKIDGDDYERQMTTITFKVEGSPNKIGAMLMLQAARHRIDCSFSSPQMVMEMERDKDKVEAKA